MGDYNRVQSYIKSHVLPKLDSLPTDVQSVKNAFDAWKEDWTQARAIKLDNLDAKVSTRATAADMGTALERVGALQTNLQSVTERVETNITETLDVKNKMPFTANGTTAKLVFSTTKGEIVNITGKGALYFAGVGSTEGSKTRKTTIGIDGKTFEIRDRGGWYVNSGKGYWLGYVNVGSSFFISSCIGAKLEGNDTYSGLNSTNIYGFSGLQQQSSVMAAISYSPLVFKKSLTITFDTSENDMFYALYELEG